MFASAGMFSKLVHKEQLLSREELEGIYSLMAQ